MVTIGETIEIDAPPEQVFDYLDDPHNHAAVTPSLTDVDDVEPLENGGKRLSFTYQMLGIGLDGELVQTHHEPNGRMTFDMHGVLEGEIDLEFEAIDGGAGTRMTYTCTYDIPGRVTSAAASPVVKRYNERDLRTTLENVKTALEASATS